MKRYAPQRHTTAYAAGKLIYEEGSKLEADLFTQVDYGGLPNRRERNLKRDIESGWLRRLGAGRIALTDWVLEFYENEPDSPVAERKFVGTVAAPRQIDVMNRKPYTTPKRLVRADAPDCSVRAIPSHYGSGE